MALLDQMPNERAECQQTSAPSVPQDSLQEKARADLGLRERLFLVSPEPNTGPSLVDARLRI